MKKRILTDADAEKMDKYLGAGTYEKWDELDMDARMQWTQKGNTDRALWLLDPKLSVYSPYGMDKVEKLHLDLIAGFDLLLLQNKVPDPAQIKTLFEIYGVAIDAAALLMDAVKSLPVIALALGLVSLRYAGLATQAAKMRSAILILDKAIRDAHAEKIEAEIQAAFGIISTTVSLVLPGTALVAKGGMTVADLLIDDKLGPQKPDPISTIGDSSKALNFYLEVMQEIKRLGVTTKTVAKKAGGVLSVTGYYFDLSEVHLARRNLKAVQEAMNKARAESAALIKLLEAEIPKLQKAHQMMTSGLNPARRNAESKTLDRDRLITAAAWSIIHPYSWRIVKDLNRVPA